MPNDEDSIQQVLPGLPTDLIGEATGVYKQVLEKRLPPARSFDDLTRRDLEQDIELKRLYAKCLLIGLGASVGVADLVFAGYCAATVWTGHQIPADAIESWLGATVVQVVGVVTIITRYLFPHRRP